MELQTQFSPAELPYFGPELRPHFLLSHFKVRGPALVAFIGPCEVKTESMVDWEDRLVNDFIRAKSMLHFLGEFFGVSLREGVLMQRMLVAIARDELAALTKVEIRRDGDDLFWGEKKLSVSIVTASPVSQLLHLGINIDASGAPVVAGGMRDLSADADLPRVLAERILGRFLAEYRSMEWACAKVRPVV